MSTSATTFRALRAIARVTITPHGWRIDLSSAAVLRSFYFATDGGAAEYARTIRDDDGWTLRFGPGAEGVKRIVADLNRGGC